MQLTELARETLTKKAGGERENTSNLRGIS